MDFRENKIEKHDTRASHSQKSFDSRFFVGILFVIIGLVLIADNFDWIPYSTSRILISWPMLLIVLGIFNLARKAYAPAVILLGVGGFFILPRIADVPTNFIALFWPAILVILGVVFMFRNQGRNRPHAEGEANRMDSVDEMAIFGGRETMIVSKNFLGGKITSIFGGSTLNLLASEPGRGCVLDVVSVFGGSKFIVPEDWNVKVEVISIFGGFADKRGPSVAGRANPEKEVVIKGACIFGGGEIVCLP